MHLQENWDFSQGLTSWVQKETPVERLFSRGRLRSRMERA